MSKLLQNGAGILFALSCIVFVGIAAYQLQIIGGLQHAAAAGQYEGQLPSAWLAVIAAFSGAASAAAVPFFGACLIDRIDRIFPPREAAE